ncbi:uncharacterized protein LOC125371791 [Haliotis rufescens]|uniref:uncharacterized protein LOC125371791 n=1 Tax=Haliotis rufescens TaxID=6454 RepID=UPI00201F5787|nr:uncharacterized protein LOC125371791 [Haliotis rufescens]
MASVFISPVKHGSFVLLVLILMNPRHTHSTTTNTTTGSSTKITKYTTTSPNYKNDNLTFESSCVALNWSAAVTDCINKDAEIFSVEYLITSLGSNVLKNATAEHTKIRININDICQTAFNGSFQVANCSDSNYYVCTLNTSTSSDWYVPCRNETTDASTQGSTTSTPQIPTTTQGSNTKVPIIAAIVCLIAVLAAVSIALGCYLIQRKKTGSSGNQVNVASEGQPEVDYYCQLQARDASEMNNYATLNEPENNERAPANQSEQND